MVAFGSILTIFAGVIIIAAAIVIFVVIGFYSDILPYYT